MSDKKKQDDLTRADTTKARPDKSIQQKIEKLQGTIDKGVYVRNSAPPPPPPDKKE
jgi:hypothetical protein